MTHKQLFKHVYFKCAILNLYSTLQDIYNIVILRQNGGSIERQVFSLTDPLLPEMIVMSATAVITSSEISNQENSIWEGDVRRVRTY